MTDRQCYWRLVVLVLLVMALAATGCRQTDSVTSAERPASQDAPSAEPSAEEPAATPSATATSATDPEPATEVAPTPEPTPELTPAATPEPTPEPTPVDLLARAEALSRLEAIPCPSVAQADNVTCSRAVLPVNAFDPDADEMVSLMVAFVDNGDPRDIGPVVYLQGGPGVGSVSLAPGAARLPHDLLLFDQRGTGLSEPQLECPEVDDLWEPQLTNDPSVRLDSPRGAVVAAYQSCRDRLVADGVALGAFHTTAVAADVELLRRLYGYERWSLWGSSYGTRVALTIMREHPEAVRSAVLDSVVPFEVDFFSTVPENAVRAMRALDNACDLDACAQDHGEFFETLTALVQRLNAEPVVVTATRPGSGATFPLRVDGTQLIDLVFTQLYSTRSLRSLPRQISRADFGGIEELVASYVSRRDPTTQDLARGLYYTTWCREEFPFYDEDRDDEFLNEMMGFFGGALDSALGSTGLGELCEIFDVEPAPAIDDMLLVSELPSLVFAGAFDPITPPSWSRQVADALGNALYVEMPDHGHGMVTSCPTQIRADFLADPNIRPDLSCVAAAGSPDFD